MPVQPVSGQPPSVPVDAHTAGLAAAARPSGVDSSTKISSLSDLREKDPALFDETLRAIAFSIVRQMRDTEEARQKRAQERTRENK